MPDCLGELAGLTLALPARDPKAAGLGVSDPFLKSCAGSSALAAVCGRAAPQDEASVESSKGGRDRRVKPSLTSATPARSSCATLLADGDSSNGPDPGAGEDNLLKPGSKC